MRMCQEGERAMNSSWRFFVVVEALLLLFAVWQIVNNTGLLLLVIFGIFNIYLAMRKHPRTKFQNFQLILGSLVIFFSLVNSPALWMMAVFAVIYWTKRCRDFRDRFNQKCFLAKETDHDGPNRAIKNT